MTRSVGNNAVQEPRLPLVSCSRTDLIYWARHSQPIRGNVLFCELPMSYRAPDGHDIKPYHFPGKNPSVRRHSKIRDFSYIMQTTAAKHGFSVIDLSRFDRVW